MIWRGLEKRILRSLNEIPSPSFPQAQFRVLAGIGHLSPLESPESLAEACFKKLSNMAESKESRNKTLVLEAFDTLFNSTRAEAVLKPHWTLYDSTLIT